MVGKLVGTALVALVGCKDAAPTVGTSPGLPLHVNVGVVGDGVHVTGTPAGEPIHLQVTSNSADMAYRTTWTLSPTACLRVVPRAGDAVALTGSPIVADYYHASRTLGVAIGAQGGAQRLLAFPEPVSFETAACPTP